MRAFFLISTLSVLLGSTSYAADLGQYRLGNPYQSVIAPGADVCESHCTGDAQCRSWNYVKASPQASGVCEFNANDVPPVASAISISGSNISETYRSGVVPGGTNTIRVGTTPIAQDRSKGQTQTSPTRRIVREPVAQQNQFQTASTRRRSVTTSQPESLTAQQNQYRRTAAPSDPRQMPQNAGPQNQVVQNGSPMIPQSFKYDLGGQPALNQSRGLSQRQAPLPQNSGPQPYAPQTYAPQTYAPQSNVSETYQRPRQQNVAPQYQPAQTRPQQGQVTRTDRRRQQGPTVHTSPVRQAPMRQEMASLPQQPQRQSYQGQSYQAPRQGQAFPPQGNYAPQNAAQNPPQNRPMVRRSATEPVTYGEASPVQIPAQMSGVQMAGRQAPSQNANPGRQQYSAQGLSAEQAQQSLFGKLNDNVQVPNSGGSVPNDPNAPIPTMTSRASGRVEQSTLAGGPN